MPNKTNDSATARFAEVARRYCTLVEGEVAAPLDMQHIRKLLAELHLAVLDLPEVEPEKNIKAAWASLEQYKAICLKFAELPIYGYWEIFDPLKDEGGEPVYQTLADDLSDIYSDLKRGLLLFEEGHIIGATWEWRLHFQIHWGEHLTGAQRAIHSYLAAQEL